MNEICRIAAWSNFSMSILVLVAAVFVLVKIRKGGNWLTLGSASFIVITQVCNMALTLIVIYKGTDNETWATIVLSILTAIVLGLNEFVMWGYAYHYWVTSQNVEIVYSNMAVMYSDLPFSEKEAKLKESTVNEISNSRINYGYISFLSILIIGYIAMNFYVLYTGDHGASGSEQ